MASRAPTLVSLFAGAGGMDFGFEAAGFRSLLAADFDPDCCQTLRLNRPRWRVLECDLCAVGAGALREAAGMGRNGGVDVLIGGPPCQPFSKSGYWATGDSRRLGDPRAATIAAYLRAVEELRPQVLVFENVEGIAYSNKDEGLRFLEHGLDRINRRIGTRYRLSFRILDAAEHGVPQVRRRAFAISVRDGSLFLFPEPSFGSQESEEPTPALTPFRTAWDALADLTPTVDDALQVTGKWAALLPSIPEGHNYLFHTARGGGLPLFGWRRRYWSFLLKLAKARPAWTVQAQPGPASGPFHWSNRRLSIAELCRLQTFPNGLRFAGGDRAIRRQIGNAVPSLLGELLGREIRRQFLGGGAVGGPLRLLPRCAGPAPAPVPPLPVAAEFLALRGQHAAHPGTGLGPRAARQRPVRGSLADPDVRSTRAEVD